MTMNNKKEIAAVELAEGVYKANCSQPFYGKRTNIALAVGAIVAGSAAVVANEAQAGRLFNSHGGTGYVTDIAPVTEGTVEAKMEVATTSHQLFNMIDGGGAKLIGPIRGAPSLEFLYARNNRFSGLQNFTQPDLDRSGNPGTTVVMASPVPPPNDKDKAHYLYVKNGRVFFVSNAVINHTAVDQDSASPYAKSDFVFEVTNAGLANVLKNAEAMSSPVYGMRTGASNVEETSVAVVATVGGSRNLYKWDFRNTESAPALVASGVVNWTKDSNGYLVSTTSSAKYVGYQEIGGVDYEVLHEDWKWVDYGTPENNYILLAHKPGGIFKGFYSLNVRTGERVAIDTTNNAQGFKVFSTFPKLVYADRQNGDIRINGAAYGNYDKNKLNDLTYGGYQYGTRKVTNVLSEDYAAFTNETERLPIFVESTSQNWIYWKAGVQSNMWWNSGPSATGSGYPVFTTGRSNSKLFSVIRRAKNTTDEFGDVHSFVQENGLKYHNISYTNNTNNFYLVFAPKAAGTPDAVQITKRARLGFQYGTDFKDWAQVNFSDHKKLLEQDTNLTSNLIIVDGSVFGIGLNSCTKTHSGNPQFGEVGGWGAGYFHNNSLFLDNWSFFTGANATASTGECKATPTAGVIDLVGPNAPLNISDFNNRIDFTAPNNSLVDSIMDPVNGRVVGLDSSGELLVGGVVFKAGTAANYDVSIAKELKRFPVFDFATPVLSSSRGTYSDHVRLSWNAVPNATYFQIWKNGVLYRDKIALTSFSDFNSNTGPSKKANYQIKAIVAHEMLPLGGFVVSQSSIEEGWVNASPTKVLGYIAVNEGEIGSSELKNDDLDADGDTYVYEITKQPTIGDASTIGATLNHAVPPGAYGVATTEVRVSDSSGKTAISNIPSVISLKTNPNILNVTGGNFEDRIELNWTDAVIDETAKVPGSEIVYEVYRKENGASTFTLIKTQKTKSFIDYEAVTKNFSKQKQPSYMVRAIGVVPNNVGVLTNTRIYETTVKTGWINRPPVIEKALATVAVGSTVNITPTISDPDSGETLSISVGEQGTFGVAAVSGARFAYTPAANTPSVDRFKMRVTDTSNVSAEAIATVYSTTTVRQNLVAAKGGSGVSIALSWDPVKLAPGVDTQVTYKVFGKGSNEASYTVLADGLPQNAFTDARGIAKTYTYTTPAQYYVEAYVEGEMPKTKIWTTKVDTGFVNNIPTKVYGVFNTNEGQAFGFTPKVDDLDSNDVRTFTILTPPQFGTATSSGTQLSYTPGSGFYGVDSFEVEAADGAGGKVRGYVTVVVSALSEQPLTVAKGEFVDRIPMSWPAVRASFGQTTGSIFYKVYAQGPTDSQFLEIQSTLAGTNYIDSRGGLRDKSVGQPMAYRYESYLILDGETYRIATSKTEQGWINNPPLASNGYAVVPTATKSIIPVTVSDPDVGDSFTFEIASPPQNGSATLTADKKVEYTSNIGFWGADSFEIEAVDISGAKVRGKVQILVVNNVGAPLTASKGDFGEKISLDWTSPTVVWADEPGEIFYKVYGKSSSDNGFSLLDPKRIDSSFDDIRSEIRNNSYLDPMTYKVEWYIKVGANPTTKVGESVEAKGWINNTPSAVRALGVTNVNTVVQFEPVVTDADMPNDVHTFEVLTQPEFGLASVNNGKLVYSPSSNFYGVDAFEFKVTDFSNKSVRGIAHVVVKQTGDKPAMLTADQSVSKDTVRLRWTDVPRTQALAGFEVFYKVEEANPGETKIVLSENTTVNTFTDNRPYLVTNKRGIEAQNTYFVRGYARVPGSDVPIEIVSMGAQKGWINTPAKVEIEDITVFQRDDAKEIPMVITDLDPDETVSLTIVQQGLYGRVYYNQLDKKLFYQPNGEVGTDTIKIGVTDRAGNYTEKTSYVQVQCQNPTINTATVKDGLQAFLFHQGALKMNTTVETCHGSVTTNVDIIDGGGNLVPTTSQSAKTPVAVNRQSEFYIRDLAPGAYTAKITIDGPTIINETVLNVPFNVRDMVLPGVTLSSETITEDDTLQISAVKVTDSCDVTNDRGDAISNGKCFIEWGALPGGIRDTGELKLLGNPLRGADQLVQAVVSVFDSAQNKREVGRVDRRVNVLPGLPLLMNHPTFPSDVRQIMDYQKHELTRKSGYNCEIVTSMEKARRIFLGDPFAKVCVFEWKSIPKGMFPIVDKPTLAGRLVDLASNRVEYQLTKVYQDGSTVELPADGYNVPLFPTSVNTAMKTSAQSYVVNGQKAKGEIEDVAARDDFHPCRLTTKIDDAKNSFTVEGAASISCLVQFKTVPNGMYAVSSTTKPTIEGIPKTLGTNPVEWVTQIVMPDGTFIDVATHSGSIVAKNAEPADIRFNPNTSLKKVNIGGVPTPVVDVGSVLGNVEVTNAEFGTVKVYVKEIGSPAIETFPRVRQGDKNDVGIRSKTNAWQIREFEASVEYEDLGAATPAIKKINFIGVQNPPVMRTEVLTMLSQIPDNKPFDVKLKVTSDVTGTFAAAENGSWEVFLAEKIGNDYAPISGRFPVGPNGEVTVTNQPPEAYNGRLVAAVVVPSNYADSGIAHYSRAETVNLVRGGAIPGVLTIDRNEGFTPHRINLNVALNDRQDQSLVSEYEFEVSKDNGATWETMERSRRGTTQRFLEQGGNYLFRTVISNSYSGAKFTTGTVGAHVIQSYRPNIVGKDLMLPGQSTTLRADVYNPTTQAPANPAEYDIVWTIDDRRSPVQRIEGASEVVVSSATMNLVNVTLSVKSKLEPETNLNAYTRTTRTINFGSGVKPRVSAFGDRFTEVGNEALIKSVIRPGWNSRADTNLVIMKEWELPDGTIIPDLDEIRWVAPDFDPNQQDERFSPTRQDHVIKLRAWVDGDKANTTSEFKYAISAEKYVFPMFAVTSRGDSLIAPAYGMLQVDPVDLRNRRYMAGKKLEYTWSVPANMQGKALGGRYSVVLEREGLYPFSVTVRDDRGNSQVLDIVLDVKEAEPYSMTFDLLPGLRFNRAPMTWIVRNQIFGGHPRDRVMRYELGVDGSVIGTSTNGTPPRMFVLDNAGTYDISLRGLSNFGKEIIANKEVTVNPNQAPDCKPLTTTINASNNVHIVSASCLDYDGRLRYAKWYINGVESRVTASRVGLDWNNDPQLVNASAADIVYEIGDDSGDVTSVSINVIRPSGAKPIN